MKANAKNDESKRRLAFEERSLFRKVKARGLLANILVGSSTIRKVELAVEVLLRI